MKKMLNLAVMLLGVALFTACEKDDNEDHGSVPVFVNSGVYVVCSGSMSSGINGALSYFEYATKKSTVNIFKDSNGRELGLTANDALRYGDKMYAAYKCLPLAQYGSIERSMKNDDVHDRSAPFSEKSDRLHNGGGKKAAGPGPGGSRPHGLLR